MSSILETIRPLVGVEPTDSSFDDELIPSINSALSVLAQLGVGPVGGVMITGTNEDWSQVITDPSLEFVKTFVQLKTRLIFDPPQSSAVIAAYEKQIDELTYRINVAVEYNERE